MKFFKKKKKLEYYWLLILLEKLPRFDPTWNSEMQERWWTLFWDFKKSFDSKEKP